MNAATADQEEKLWAALGEPSRLRVLDALLDRGEATSTLLAQGLPLTRQGVTKHLAVLGRVGLVAGRRQGREVHYAVDPDRLAEAARAMSAVAAKWDRRLGRIKALAEAIHTRRQLAAGDK